MIELSIDLFQKVKTQLLPTPAKSHYLFNIRQLTELMQGVLMVPTDVVQKSREKL